MDRKFDEQIFLEDYNELIFEDNDRSSSIIYEINKKNADYLHHEIIPNYYDTIFEFSRKNSLEKVSEDLGKINLESQKSTSVPDDDITELKSDNNSLLIENVLDCPKTEDEPEIVEKKIPVKSIKCNECDKLFLTKQKLNRHLWIHRKKMFTCDVCSINFETNIELENHWKSLHSDLRAYVCRKCYKTFNSRQGVWEHTKSHNSQFSCELCNKTFSSRQGFLIHNRLHTNEKPFNCQFCTKAFRDAGTLRKHQRVHTGEKPYQCPLCPKNFSQKVLLREHVRWIHTNEKIFPESPFECPLCKMTVMNREELCAHLVKHSDKLVQTSKQLNPQKKTATATVTLKNSSGSKKDEINSDNELM